MLLNMDYKSVPRSPHLDIRSVTSNNTDNRRDAHTCSMILRSILITVSSRKKISVSHLWDNPEDLTACVLEDSFLDTLSLLYFQTKIRRKKKKKITLLSTFRRAAVTCNRLESDCTLDTSNNLPTTARHTWSDLPTPTTFLTFWTETQSQTTTPPASHGGPSWPPERGSPIRPPLLSTDLR